MKTKNLGILTFSLFLSLTAHLAYADGDKNKRGVAPDVLGPYAVGYSVRLDPKLYDFDPSLSYVPTDGAVLIWYPADRNRDGSLPSGTFAKYNYAPGTGTDVNTNNTAFFSDFAKYDLQPAKGKPFPMIISVGGDSEWLNNEHLASQGFVVVSVNAVAGVGAPYLPADNCAKYFGLHKEAAKFVLALSKNNQSGNPFKELVNPEQIGSQGMDWGGGVAINLGAGDIDAQQFGLDATPLKGLRAAIISESPIYSGTDTPFCSTNYAASTDLKVLLFGGTSESAQFASGLEALRADFSLLPSRTRYLIETQNIAHRSLFSTECQRINNVANLLFLISPDLSATDPFFEFLFGYAADAVFSDLIPGPGGYAPFGDRLFCDASYSGIRALAQFFGAPYTTTPALVQFNEIQRLKRAYATAFFKAYVAKDEDYLKYLVPGQEAATLHVGDTNGDGIPDAVIRRVLPGEGRDD